MALRFTDDLFARVCEQYAATGKVPETSYELEDGRLIPDYQVPFYVDASQLRDLEKVVLARHARGTVLDVGCGPGRVSSWLAPTVDATIGVDKSWRMCELAMRKGLPIYRADVAEALPRVRPQTVLLFGNGFGMPGDPQALKQVFGALHTMTAPGALIIGESNDPTLNPLEQKYDANNVSRGDPVGLRRWRFRVGERVDHWHAWMQYKPEHLDELANQTGWRTKEVLYEKDSIFNAYFAVLERQ